MQGPPSTPTDQAKAPIPIETVSMSNGPAMKAEDPIPTETVSMNNGSNMKAEAPIPTETVSMSNGSNMKAEAPIPTETVSLSNGSNMKAEAPIPTVTVSMSNGSNMKAEAPIPTETVSMSNGPSMKAEASIPTETVSTSNGPSMNRTVKISRKAAKRTLPWDQAAGELLMSQDEDNPARKKPRLEEPLPTTTDEAAGKTASPDLSVGLPPTAADIDEANANTDPLTDAQPNAEATWATGFWSKDEDAELSRAVANTSKMKWGKGYTTNWVAISALVPSRTRLQCWRRWHDVLDPSIDRTPPERTGKWTPDEDSKLKDAVHTHGGKEWAAITALVPGRTGKQCYSRWKDNLDPSISRGNGRAGGWTVEEATKLEDTVLTHGDKNWKDIAALVPGRTNKQCRDKWKNMKPYCGTVRGKGRGTLKKAPPALGQDLHFP
jgi:hypothetical protein